MITGIISEYNPFHNGHKFQIEQARKMGSEYIIAIMSGNFTQRGEPTITDKYSRTEMALINGVDLVIELPVIFATGDAGIFARGGVNLLNSLGVVDRICFGTETGSISFLSELVTFFNNPPNEYLEKLDLLLKSGLNFPTARSTALKNYFKETDIDLIKGSNMILGIEYCQALKELNSNIIPLPIERKGADYNDDELDFLGLSSASAIRKVLSECCNTITDTMGISGLGYSSHYISLNSLKEHMPEASVEILVNSPLMFPEDFSSILHHKLIMQKDFSKYLDITESFSKRIIANRFSYSDYYSFCGLLKTKNITHASVQRLLSHILLEINEMPRNVGYARVLGFKKGTSELLSKIKANSKIPLITKLADAAPNPCLEADIKAAHLYEALKSDKYGTKFQNEYSRQLVMVD